MTISEFFAATDLEKSLLIGYYGGGNFGDELLLETLLLLFQRKGIKNAEICYQSSVKYETYHHDFTYPRVPMHDKKQFLKAIFRNRTMIVGGGGLWGLDVNTNIFLMSLLLFMSRWLLGKKVFLVGVGYYNSTNKLGRVSAWLAGKAANHIIVRDDESAANFGKVTQHVSQDRDIAWQLESLPESLVTYETEARSLDNQLLVSGRTLFITIRRFKPNQQNDYNDRVVQLLNAFSDSGRRIVVNLMEPRSVDPAGYATLVEWQKHHPHIIISDFNYNPVTFYVWLKQHASQLAIIAPQFHLIAAALMTQTVFLPIAYDNKVNELIKQAGLTPIPIKELDDTTVQLFVDTFLNDQPTSPAGGIA